MGVAAEPWSQQPAETFAEVARQKQYTGLMSAFSSMETPLPSVLFVSEKAGQLWH